MNGYEGDGMLTPPGDTDLLGLSLYLVVTITSPAGETADLTIASSLPIGQLITWSDPVAPIALAEQSAEVTLTRDLGGLFHGIDFESMTTEVMARAILFNLRDQLSVAVE